MCSLGENVIFITGKIRYGNQYYFINSNETVVKNSTFNVLQN